VTEIQVHSRKRPSFDGTIQKMNRASYSLWSDINPRLSPGEFILDGDQEYRVLTQTKPKNFSYLTELEKIGD